MRKKTNLKGRVVAASLLIVVSPLATLAANPDIGGDPIHTEEDYFFTDDWGLTVYSYVFDNTSTSLPGSLVLDPGEMLFMYLLDADISNAVSVDHFAVGNPELLQVNTVDWISNVVPSGYNIADYEAPHVHGHSNSAEAFIFDYFGDFGDPWCTLDPGEYSLVYYVVESVSYGPVSATAEAGGVGNNQLLAGVTMSEEAALSLQEPNGDESMIAGIADKTNRSGITSTRETPTVGPVGALTTIPDIGGDPIHTEEDYFSAGDWGMTVYSYVFDNSSASLPGDFVLSPGEMLFMYLLDAGVSNTVSVDHFAVGNPGLATITTVDFEAGIVPVGFEMRTFEDPYLYGYSGMARATIFTYFEDFGDPWVTLDPGEYSLVYCIAESTSYREVSATADGGGVGNNQFVPGPTTVPPHFNLTFPLQNRNAYNARITAVFDHSMLDSYCPDDKMVTYSGEETTDPNTSYSPIDPIGCGPLYSFNKPGGGAFLVGKVNYVGIEEEEKNLVLQYDAHPGYDYPDDLGSPVLAAAEGDLYVVDESQGWVKIIHDGVGAGYETHYLHLNWHIGPGMVARGQLIGKVGNKGASSGYHLHFEVRHEGIPVDPYGWEGSGTDPYMMLTGAVNVRLWETLDTGNPGIDYILGSPADMVVTDPDGLHISKELNQIPRAAYDEVDIDGDGDFEDRVSILHKKVGEYLIDVIPEPNALPTDTYSLEALIEGQTMVLAEDVQIQDIPNAPYVVESKLNRADFDSDGDVDIADLNSLSQKWLAGDCNYPGWCEGTDLNYDGPVDFVDFSIFAKSWLWETIRGDFDIDGDVDFEDFGILGLAWLTEPGDEEWNQFCDIGTPDDDYIDWGDLKVLADNWLARI